MKQALFDAPREKRSPVGRSLLPLALDGCLTCGGFTVVATMDEPSLFRHGGYGGTTRTVTRWCPSCKRGRVCRRETINPRSHS